VAVHHAGRRAAPVAGPGPCWAFPAASSSDLLVDHVGAEVIVHERIGEAVTCTCCTTKTRPDQQQPVVAAGPTVVFPSLYVGVYVFSCSSTSHGWLAYVSCCRVMDRDCRMSLWGNEGGSEVTNASCKCSAE
jgi:hypothetical protein